ncbi:uncharacterized protein [Elaeis guineensis]|uniref:uncharacterized protein n=1 Tax=Elaeis guineensis var. tenera TaxID=51953 RepID=UPI003C6D4610
MVDRMVVAMGCSRGDHGFCHDSARWWVFPLSSDEGVVRRPPFWPLRWLRWQREWTSKQCGRSPGVSRPTKEKGAAASGSVKKARTEETSSATPAQAALAVDVPSDVEPPAPRASSKSSPAEVLASGVRFEEVPGVERERRRKSVARRVSSHRAANEEPHGSEEEPGENPFNDRDLIKRLINGCILSEVVQRIDRADPEQRVWDSLGSFLEIGHQLLANIEATNRARRDAIQAEESRRAEVVRFKEKVAEVANLQEALEKEKQISEETVRKAEAEIANLTEQISILISEARVLAVEEFKASAEMRDLNVKFDQKAFIKGFELCQEKVVKKFFEFDLSFLNEVSEDEVGPSPTATVTAASLPRTPSSPTSTSEV